MNRLQQQMVALGGLFQAASAVHQIGQTGTCDTRHFETAINSLFATNPESTESVYGGLNNIKTGLELTLKLLDRSETNDLRYIVRYGLSILHLERKLNKNPDMLNEIAQRIERSKSQAEHFDILHENVINSLASIYLDTISTFQLRLQVSGHERHLTVELNAAKIRTLLLAGICSAHLWRQLGGHRWHFIFKKRAALDACKELLSQCE